MSHMPILPQNRWILLNLLGLGFNPNRRCGNGQQRVEINHEIQEKRAFITRTFNHFKNTSVLLHVVLKKYHHEKQHQKHNDLNSLVKCIIAVMFHLFHGIP